MRWRDGLLVVISLVVGPPIVALVTLLGIGIAQHGVGAIMFFDVQFYFGALPFSYFLGSLPMLAVAIVNVVVARFLSEPWRLVAALPIGAVIFLMQLSWLSESDAGASRMIELFGIGLGGALASVVSVALIEAFGSKVP